MILTTFQRRLLAEMKPDVWYAVTPGSTGAALPGWLHGADVPFNTISGLIESGHLMFQEFNGRQILKPYMKALR